jgi:flagellar assembly protein FliH
MMSRGDHFALFSDDFDALEAAARRARDAPAEPIPPPPRTYSEEELDSARALARSEGYAEGTRDAALSQAANITATLARIATFMEDAAASAARTTEQSADVFAKVLFAAMVAGFPSLRAKWGAEEVRAVVRRALPGLLQETYVNFQVHPSMVPVIEAELAAVPLKERSHMTIESMDDIPIGDARLSWPNGGAIRDTVKIHEAIIDILKPLGLLADE